MCNLSKQLILRVQYLVMIKSAMHGYKAQLTIVKQIENPQTSTNSDLEILIIDAKSDMPSVDPGDVEEVIL